MADTLTELPLTVAPKAGAVMATETGVEAPEEEFPVVLLPVEPFPVVPLPVVLLPLVPLPVVPLTGELLVDGPTSPPAKTVAISLAERARL